jgi:hypothetical protein
MDNTTPVDVDSDAGGITVILDEEPEMEKAAFKKFDRYVLPVSVIFMVLSSLDRNNVRLIICLPSLLR